MEFDVKGRIRFFAKQIEEREYLRDIEYELGYDGYKTLCEIVEFKRKITEEEFELIKQSYLDAQKGKTLSGRVVESGARDFYECDDEQFKAHIDACLLEDTSTKINIDAQVINILNGAGNEKYIDSEGNEVKISGTKLEERQKCLRDVLRKYIKEGYNPYPLMLKINEEYEELSNMKETPEVLEGKLDCSRKQILMERMEAASPYKAIFDRAERLGRLIEEERQMRMDEDYDGIEELNERIDQERESLTKYIERSGFDLDELTTIINGKKEYIQKTEKGFNYHSVNYAMFLGLQEANRRIKLIKIQQEKQNQV